MKPKGIESSGKIKPEIPVIKIRSIAVGINNKIKIFAGIDTSDKIPVR